ncbi:MAG: GNAT family N-acetyltransferase [Candidatus Dormibacter sp.]
MSDIELVNVERADLDAFVATMRRLFGQRVSPGHAHIKDILARSTLARLDGVDVGTAAVMDLRLTVPGGTQVTMDGVTVVVVSPVARRRGVLRALMDRVLADAHERGAAVLGLGATESSIYRRFGYGVASYAGSMEIETAHAAFRVPFTDPGRLRAVALEDALQTWVDVDRRQLQRVGGITRSEAIWRRLLTPDPEADGKGIVQVVVHEDAAGTVDGYVNYRQEIRWRDDLADGIVHVLQFGAVNRTAHVALWQHLLNLDLCEHLETDRYWLDDPIQHLLRDPRRLRVVPNDDLHLRVVDVIAMLQARRYSREDAIVIAVLDDACPDIAGRYRLDGGIGGAHAARTDAPADIVLDGAALGSIMLGDVSVAALFAAGLVDERTPGAVRRASAMFAWQPRPWLTYMF